MTAKGEALRFDETKPRTDLLPPGPLLALAELYGWGCSKYGENNWRGGMAWSRCIGSCLRHIFAWMSGEDLDPESGINHLVHGAWNLLALVEYADSFPEGDDRWRGRS